ncbi:probable diphthine methyl ester synthase [Olea europaea subsp. europaea]|uniref:diphthine methyl ester synthase n=1 Tax=Olea europaea subsp. europaea TaxID=158383 RepID=A0A8S0UUY3_OLEEU|nr:probable diphthine methyl ester synthase [Olea europaea subsp. europaea]
MEAYTSLLSFGLSSLGKSTLENLYGKLIIVADRETVEEKTDDILSEAQSSDVAFLVVGDPLGATTHTDLVVRAKKLGVDVKVVYNASVMNAIGVCWLQLYRYGEIISIPFFTENWRPDSFYEKIRRNRTLGLHTLCWLAYSKDTTRVGLARVGSEDQAIVTVADRETVEEKTDDILSEAQSSDVAFLVVGDPFGATTHTDLVLRAKKLGVDVKVVHNALVMNAIGVCWLQLYRYGEIISIPFFIENWRPDSFYEKIRRNRTLGLHTLCWLAYGKDTTSVGLARVGSEDQVIVTGSMKQLLTIDFGPPLHCLVIVGNVHPVEEEMLEFYTVGKSSNQAS